VRVAYIEGGFYTDYSGILVALAQSLAELGVIENGNAPVPENVDSTAGTWQWLHDNAGGSAIEFVADGYYSAGWDDAVFAEKRAELIARLNTARDIDLVLAFGTKAGQAMATDDYKTPVAVLSVTDAVTAGIIPSPEDSGRDHVFAMVEHNRYYREVVLFHDIFKFKRLGIAYEDSEKGRASVALPQIQKAARDSNFELVTCVDTLFDDPAPATANLIACHERLVKEGVDAVYMTVNNGMQAETMADSLRPLMEERLPTFSQNGVDEVKHGVLLSISQVNFSGQGMFAAKAIANIIKGESPRSQKQSYEEPLSLALNLRTAMLIGWNPSLAVLSAVDEIFQEQ
jgi:ABC-type uncharacterized transport system substrate-binding protein